VKAFRVEEVKLQGSICKKSRF